MTTATRAFLAGSLAALLVAALLHLLVVLGVGAAWSAMVHLVIFGWITGMILAVNSHAMPVFTARDFPEPRVLHVQWTALQGGLVATTSGLLLRHEGLTRLGLALEVVAAILFLVSIVQLLAKGIRRATPAARPNIPHQKEIDTIGTRATMVAGVAYPVATLLLLAARLWPQRGELWLAAEHLATLGWVMGMVVGVGNHILPRFSGQGARSVRVATVQLVTHALSLLLVVVALSVGWTPLFALGASFMGMSLALFAWNLWPTLHAIRARPAVIPITQITEMKP